MGQRLSTATEAGQVAPGHEVLHSHQLPFPSWPGDSRARNLTYTDLPYRNSRQTAHSLQAHVMIPHGNIHLWPSLALSLCAWVDVTLSDCLPTMPAMLQAYLIIPFYVQHSTSLKEEF